MKNFLTTKDLTKEEIEKILKEADSLKDQKGVWLKGKTLVMYFEKPSLRTVISFNVAMEHLGGHSIFLSNTQVKLGERESIKDFAGVLSRYVDGIMARLFSHDSMMELGKQATIPVINGLDELEHPCQAMADMYAIKNNGKMKEDSKIVFLGDGANNTFHSLIYLCNRFGMEVVISCPEEYKPTIEADFKIIENPKEAIKDADVIYTDVFVSMGLESEKKKRMDDLNDYKLTADLLKLAKNDAIVLHPMPMKWHEITEQVAYGKNSVIFDQAENRLHVQKAILYLLMK
jgi:ornithine carbamoyltransferase